MAKEIKKYSICVDSREQTPWAFKAVDWCGGSTVGKLDTGDYSLAGFEDKFAVERKASTSEIANNIFESRFPDVLGRLNEVKHSFVVCEFTWDDIMRFPQGSGIPHSRWGYIKVTPDIIQKSLTNYFLKYSNIHWLFFNGREAAQAYTRQLFKRVIQLYE